MAKPNDRLFFCPRCGETHEEGGLVCWVPFRSDEFWRGAALAFGLIGMAEAIRRGPDYLKNNVESVSQSDCDHSFALVYECHDCGFKH